MKFICTFSLIFIFFSAYTQDTLRLSLKDALDKIDQRAAYKNAMLEEELAFDQLSEAYVRLFPQIAAYADVRDYIRRPTSLIPGEFANKPGSRIPVQFNTKYSLETGINLTQPIIDFNAFRGLKLAKLNTQIAQVNSSDSLLALKYTAARDYLTVLIIQEQIEQQKSRIKRNEDILVYTRERFRNGLSPEVDVKRAEADFANAGNELQKLEKERALSVLLLSFHSGIEFKTSVVLTDKATADTILPVENTDVTMLPRYQRQALVVKYNFVELNRQKTSAYPSLSAYAFVGQQALGDKFKPLENKSMPWYPFSYIGLRLNWNISALYTNLYTLPRYRAGVRQQENLLAELDEQLMYNVKAGETNFYNTLTDFKIAIRNRDVFQANREYVYERYKLGITTMRELAEAEGDYTYALNQYYISLLNANLSRYDYLRITGKL